MSKHSDKVKLVAEATLDAFDAALEANDACVFCSGMTIIEALMRGIADDPEVELTKLGIQIAEMLTEVLNEARAERAASEEASRHVSLH